jgi:hypothetical protein
MGQIGGDAYSVRLSAGGHIPTITDYQNLDLPMSESGRAPKEFKVGGGSTDKAVSHRVVCSLDCWHARQLRSD